MHLSPGATSTARVVYDLVEVATAMGVVTAGLFGSYPIVRGSDSVLCLKMWGSGFRV